MKDIELWGGVECTVARFHDRTKSQLKKSGHLDRFEDIDMICDLGITGIRYPVLHEMVCAADSCTFDFSWIRPRLERFRERGVEVIATLLHHGNGAEWTDMLDPHFAEHIAAYARRVAEEFPWIKYWTVCNEPLTTARFCGLYKVWYPHKSSDQDFLRMLYNQCRATILAMRTIREINPDAQLVHTEDLGKTYATPAMVDLARFYNDRRWLSTDLLVGAVDEKHSLWKYLTDHELREEELYWMQGNSCVPDILGINTYITSERVLDERTEYYPHLPEDAEFADIEAVRAVPEILGHYGLLKEAWERYRLPIALTEVQLAAESKDQIRWFGRAWDACHKLKGEGADIRAITAWSVLGAYEWNSLLTRDDNFYEPGAFDVSSGEPVQTELGVMIEKLAKEGEYFNVALRSRGWWEEDERFHVPPLKEYEKF